MFNRFCCILDGLAFSPIDYVPKGMLYLKSIMTQEASELESYFNFIYIESNMNRKRFILV